MFINAQFFLKSFVKDVKESIRFQIYKQYLPKNPKHDDIYLVEFPKSGITWLSFIIAYIELARREIDEFPTFFNIHRFIPDIHQLRGGSINRIFSPTFIKSHSGYNPYYYYVTYILRNPIDVMVSYYNFQRYFGYQGDFSSFVRHKKFGIKAWVKHVKGWLLKKPDAQRIHVVKYEELLSAPKDVMINLYKNLGIRIDERIIERAISQASLKKMKESEEMMIRYNPRFKKAFFVGKEGKLKREELLTAEIEKYILDSAKEMLQKFYPNLLKYSNGLNF